MTWFELLCRALGRDDLTPAGAGVPFAVRSDGEIAWHEPELVQRGDRAWELKAGSPQGLEAVWQVREHPDTRAVECSGTVRNAGRVAVDAVRELWTLDLPLGLTEAWGEPHLRTVNGARFLPFHFPPDDFRSRDRQLLRSPQAYVPVVVHAHPDGRSSGHSLPCAILCGERSDRGIALFYEWSGLWSIAFHPEPTAAGTAGACPWTMRVSAGVWGLKLDLQPGEELPLPSLLIAGFDGDLDAGGNALRRHIGRHVAPTLGGERPLPPTSFNPYFAFTSIISDKALEPAVKVSAEAGLEYFSIDASWLPRGFRHGVGNWFSTDTERFPDIPAFARFVADHGMLFGLWLELEFAHVESEIYAAHPEWFLHGPRVSPWTRPTELFYPDGVFMVDEFDLGERFTLIDFGQADARQWALDRIVEAYERWDMRWLRWDFCQPPRPYWDHSAPAGRLGLNQINHVQGLYSIFDEVLRVCPDLFVEQTGAGGHRIDLGTVRRGHALWMNDHTTHTDIVRGLQHGLNTVLPGIYANTNLCQGRMDYTDYDYLSHGGGSMGYSGRLWEASRSELERFAAAIERFKGYRHLLGGEYTRSTGQAEHRYDRAHVAWSDGGETVEMEFNGAGPRTAELRLSAP